MNATVRVGLERAAERLTEGLGSPWVATVLMPQGCSAELFNAECVPQASRAQVFGEAAMALVKGAPRSTDPVTVTIGAEGVRLGLEAPRFVMVPIVAEVGLHGAFFAPAPNREPDPTAVRAARLAGATLLEASLQASHRALKRGLELHELGRPVGCLIAFDEDERVLFTHCDPSEGEWPVLSRLSDGMGDHADANVTDIWEDADVVPGGLLRRVSSTVLPWRTDSLHVLGLALRVVNLSEQLSNSVGDHGDEQRLLIEKARALAGRAMEAVEVDRLREKLDIAPIMEEARAWFEPILRSEGVQVIALGGVDLPHVKANPFLLRHVFRILIDRVRRSRKGKSGILSCRAWAESGHVLVAVSDNGRGIPASEVKPQYQKWGDDPAGSADLHEDPHRLAELKRLLAPVGAKLEVESRPRIWTRFTVRFPIHGAVEGAEAASSEGAALPPAIQVLKEEPGGLEVLVVDDNQQIRDVLRRFLLRLGHRVTVAEDGALALKVIGNHDFDRILLDVNMPGQSGPAFYSSLDDHAPQLQERTIFMTGGVVEEEVNGFIRQTGRPRLGKPFMLDELVRVLQ
jgi:CheY-like chemotaxis protein/signal transduction histidine kinase